MEVVLEVMAQKGKRKGEVGGGGGGGGVVWGRCKDTWFDPSCRRSPFMRDSGQFSDYIWKGSFHAIGHVPLQLPMPMDSLYRVGPGG